MNAFGITDKGKVRSANQDAYRLSLSPDGEYVLAALCDGMGGVHGGEIASAVAADSFMQYAEDMLRREPKSDAAQVLREPEDFREAEFRLRVPDHVAGRPLDGG